MKALKEAILHPLSSDCLVVGITGEWGSGKTSLKNLLKEEILRERTRGDSEEAKKSLIAEFDPWLYSGRGELISMMFLDISKNIKPVITGVKSIFNNFRKHASKALGIAAGGAESIATKSNTPFTIPNTPTGITLSIGDKALAACFRALSDILKPGSDDIANLVKVRTKLKKTLEKKGKRVIVFIDDIDRLTDNEVCDIFRTIKMVGDLPNVTYVLMYDQGAVARSLDALANGRGEEYLKKLVQVSLHIPEFNTDKVWEQLDKEISNIYDKWPGLYHFKTVNGKPAGFQYFIQPFIKSPRDSVRFVNTLKMEYAALREDVEFDDLVCMVSLELFKPKLRQWIYNHGTELCHYKPDDTIDIVDHGSNRRARLEQYPDTASQGSPARHAIDTLFPESTRQNEPSPASNTIYNIEHFYKYFRFLQPDNLIRESEYISFILDNSHTPLSGSDERLNILLSPQLPSKAARYLSPIHNEEQLQAFITHIINEIDSTGNAESYWQLIRIIDEMMIQYNNHIVTLVDSIGTSFLSSMFTKEIATQVLKKHSLKPLFDITSSIGHQAKKLPSHISKTSFISIVYLESILQIALHVPRKYKTLFSCDKSINIEEKDKFILNQKSILIEHLIITYISEIQNLHLETTDLKILQFLFKNLMIISTQDINAPNLDRTYSVIKRHIENHDYYNLLVWSNAFNYSHSTINDPDSLVPPSDLLHTLESTNKETLNAFDIKTIIDNAIKTKMDDYTLNKLIDISNRWQSESIAREPGVTD
ncbi:KAP family P-loop NTPase fold protein [Bifidobacterium aesculapii]|uniref:KAP family P-loop NTPase fold protein n=1 Tax=Bifidobacterium aesculapii TaxID=1329411 RepID=UPI001364CBF0|nr:P-loop NTPase fold protein [Bifidobacterium aesculapii]